MSTRMLTASDGLRIGRALLQLATPESLTLCSALARELVALNFPEQVLEHPGLLNFPELKNWLAEQLAQKEIKQCL